MVTITPIAREELKRIVESGRLEAGKHLRLATAPLWEGEQDFGIVIDGEGGNDLVVDQDGVELLLVDAELSERLANAVLDFVDSPQGPRFTLDVY